MATIWDGGTGGIIEVSGDNTFIEETFVVGAMEEGKTVFVLTTFQYKLNYSSLIVFVNTAYQRVTKDYVETNPTTITFTSGLRPGDEVVIRGLVGSEATQSAADSAQQAQDILDAILALEPPALPLTVNKGGTGATTKSAAFDNLTPLTNKGQLIAHNGTTSTVLVPTIENAFLVSDSTADTGFKFVSGAGTTGFVVLTDTVSMNELTAPVVELTQTLQDQYVTLPNAVLIAGLPVNYTFNNTGDFAHGIKLFGGAILGWVLPKSTARVSLMQNFDGESNAGSWATQGLIELAVVSSFTNVLPGVNFQGSTALTAVELTATQTLLFLSGVGLSCFFYNETTKTLGSPVTIVAAGTAIGAVEYSKINSSTVVLSYVNFATGFLTGVVVTITAGVPTVHTADEVSINMSDTSITKLWMTVCGESRYMVVTSQSRLSCACFDVTGTVCTQVDVVVNLSGAAAPGSVVGLHYIPNGFLCFYANVTTSDTRMSAVILSGSTISQGTVVTFNDSPLRCLQVGDNYVSFSASSTVEVNLISVSGNTITVHDTLTGSNPPTNTTQMATGVIGSNIYLLYRTIFGSSPAVAAWSISVSGGTTLSDTASIELMKSPDFASTTFLYAYNNEAVFQLYESDLSIIVKMSSTAGVLTAKRFSSRNNNVPKVYFTPVGPTNLRKSNVLVNSARAYIYSSSENDSFVIYKGLQEIVTSGLTWQSITASLTTGSFVNNSKSVWVTAQSSSGQHVDLAKISCATY